MPKSGPSSGEKVVLVRRETSPEDIEGMAVAQGILTVRGGMTSHAAVVARGMGTCCVSGCGEIEVDYDAKFFTLGGMTIKRGRLYLYRRSTGNIYGQAIPTVEASISGDFGRFMEWADKERKLEVYTNADTPRDAKQAFRSARRASACAAPSTCSLRATRIKAMREMIVADNTEDRKKGLAKILPYQQSDFEGIYEAMEGCRSSSVSSIRRCMSSCRPRRRTSRRSPVKWASLSRSCTRLSKASARVQSDDGPPRLPPVRLLSGDRRDADDRCHQRGHQRNEEAAVQDQPEHHDPAGR